MRKTIFAAVAAASVLAASIWAAPAEACSRVVYKGLDSTLVVGRSLDWKTPIPTSIYVYPRGVAKKGSDKPGAVEWTSKYGAVYSVSYMNATTAEVVDVLEKHDFSLSGATFDHGTVSALHWGVTDATGASVIFEFDNGEIKIYDMGDYRAMTNDPEWPAMTAIIDYWEGIGGKNMLPGTVSSPSRCVRANYFAHHVEPVADPELAISITRSIIADVAVPYSYLIEGEPNLSSTQWKTYSDLKNARYCFEYVTGEGYCYVDLRHLDLYPGAPVLKLSAKDLEKTVGNANRHLVRTQPFTPMF